MVGSRTRTPGPAFLTPGPLGFAVLPGELRPSVSWGARSGSQGAEEGGVDASGRFRGGLELAFERCVRFQQAEVTSPAEMPRSGCVSGKSRILPSSSRRRKPPGNGGLARVGRQHPTLCRFGRKARLMKYLHPPSYTLGEFGGFFPNRFVWEINKDALSSRERWEHCSCYRLFSTPAGNSHS